MGETIQLRKYQRDAVDDLEHFLAEGEPVVELVSPPGSGKTTIVRCLASVLTLYSGEWRGLCVGVPQRQIRSGFSDGPDIEYDYDGEIHVFGDEAWEPGANSKSIRRLLHGESGDRFASVACYPTIINAADDVDNFEGLVLVIDEAHHIEETNRLGELCERWVEGGGQIVVISASPFRNTGVSVFDRDLPGFSRTIVDHATDRDEKGRPFMPQNLKLDIVEFDGYGEDGPDNDLIAAEVVKRWHKDKRPKAVVIIPPGDADSQAETIGNALELTGCCRVLNAVGIGKHRQDEVMSVLATERLARRLDDSKVDVIIACKRFDEATDWPMCSHVYVVGFPTNLLTTVQRWGRTFRDKSKINGHQHRNDAHIVFMDPTPSGHYDEDSEKRRHGEHALLAACALHEFDVVKNIRIRPGLNTFLSKSYGESSVRREMSRLDISDQDTAKARMELAKLRLQTGPVSGRELLKKWEEASEDLSPQVVRAGRAIIASDAIKGVKAGRVAEILDKSAKASKRRKSPIVEAEREAINAILDEFGAVKTRVHDGLIRTASRFCGQSIAELSERVSRASVSWDKVDLGKRSDGEIARELGVSPSAVRLQRVKRGIPAFGAIDWDKVDLGKRKDREIARELGVSPSAVLVQRRKRGIPAFGAIDWDKVDLGKRKDPDIARELGVSPTSVRFQRVKRGIPVFEHRLRKWRTIDWDKVDLGKRSDCEIARELGVNPSCVWFQRDKRGIPPFDPSSECQEAAE